MSNALSKSKYEWKEYRFSEMLVDGNISYGIVQPGAHTETDSVPIIRVNNIKNGNINSADVLKVASTIEEKYQRTRLSGGELLITVVGSVGECAIVPTTLAGWNVARAVSVARIKENFDKRFVKYVFKTEDVKFQMYGNTNDTVQPTLNLSSLKEIKLILPPLPEQRAIAGVLSSLDDKIDLLHRQNKTLEGMAEAVYRHFFVDNRKVNWKECSIGELANHQKTSIHPNRNPAALFYHYSIHAFDEVHMPVHELGTLIQSNKYEVTKNTILFSKLNPHKDKRIWLIPSLIAENSVCSTEFQVMSPKADKYLFFLYGFISHPENYNKIAAGVGGTSSSHQRIDPEVIFTFKCFLPDDGTLTKYHEIVEPIFAKIHHNRQSIRALIHQRDLLLPKLMSGEIRINGGYL